jgi:hypothetical protein
VLESVLADGKTVCVATDDAVGVLEFGMVLRILRCHKDVVSLNRRYG